MKDTFGCPMYILNSKLQSGQKIPKWEARPRLAIYIGPSLYHARSIGLGLNLTTGLVSPAYHAKYDDTFATITPQFTTCIPKSLWQMKCGFQKEPHTMELELVSQDKSNGILDNLNDTYSEYDVNDLQLRVNINQQNDENNTHMPMDVNEDIELDQHDKKSYRQGKLKYFKSELSQEQEEK
jgi:hypothetical protein